MPGWRCSRVKRKAGRRADFLESLELTRAIGLPLAPTFIDQSSSRRMPANTPTRNIPSRSYHILNLNL